MNTDYELLDFVINIALFQLQLYLYNQAIQKNRDVAYHKIEEIKKGNWKSVLSEGIINNSQQVLKYLNQISNLKVIQEQ